MLFDQTHSLGREYMFYLVFNDVDTVLVQYVSTNL